MVTKKDLEKENIVLRNDLDSYKKISDYHFNDKQKLATDIMSLQTTNKSLEEFKANSTRVMTEQQDEISQLKYNNENLKFEIARLENCLNDVEVKNRELNTQQYELRKAMKTMSQFL